MSAEKDDKALRAIGARRDTASGWSRVLKGRGEWLELSGLSKSSWHRSVDSLEARGLIEPDAVTSKEGRAGAYYLTPAGLTALGVVRTPGGHLSQDLSQTCPNEGRPVPGGEGGASSSCGTSSSCPVSTKREIPDPLEPRTIAPYLSQPWDRSDELRARAHELIDILLGFQGAEDETRMEQVKAPAPAPLKPVPAVVRDDGLYWDAQSEPELASALEAFRSKRSTRADLGHAWELARQHPAEWIMRAFAHAAIRWTSGHRSGWRINDAWGYFWKTAGCLVKGGGTWAGLEFDARMPDARDSFRAGLAALTATSDAEARALRRVGLKVASDEPPLEALLERQRRGAKLIGLPQRLPPPAPSLVDAMVAEGPTRRPEGQAPKRINVGSIMAALTPRADR